MINPDIYICDIEVHFKYIPKSTEKTILLEKVPVLLLNNQFPSEQYKMKFLAKNLNLKKIEDYSFKIKILSSKFSSKIQYDFFKQ